MISNKNSDKKNNIIEFSTIESQCVYLPNERMRMRYKYIKNASFSLNSKLTQRGWRRFGEYYSRPFCKACSKCLSLRIDAQNFRFSKSVRRTFRKNKNTSIVLQKPSVSTHHLRLYEKYHKFMEKKKGWKYTPLSPAIYSELYVQGHGDFGKEILYFHNFKLVGVDLIDICEDGISSIYFYYDPDFSKLSLGRYSIYQQILMAKKYNLKWIYLGYYVKECNSLNYKSSYTPYQILKGNPSLEEEPVWFYPPDQEEILKKIKARNSPQAF